MYPKADHNYLFPKTIHINEYVNYGLFNNQLNLLRFKLLSLSMVVFNNLFVF